MWAGDYTLSGLVGFELRCKTVGVVGTGAIGAAAARIFCVSCLCAAPRCPCAGIVASRQSVSHEDAQLCTPAIEMLGCRSVVASQSEDAALPCDAVRLRAVALCADLAVLDGLPPAQDIFLAMTGAALSASCRTLHVSMCSMVESFHGECAALLLLQGFGAKVIAHDLYESEALKKLGVTYVSKEELLQQADVISLHCPLLPSTYHIIDKAR